VSVETIRASLDLLGMLDMRGIRPAGAGKWRGRCPLCDVRTGFAIGPHPRGGYLSWRCFGCHLHGDALDMYAALNRVTLAEAIRALDDGKREEPADRVQRLADAARASEGAYVLACDGCGRCREVRDVLEAAVIAGNGSWQWGRVGKLWLCAACLPDDAFEDAVPAATTGKARAA
jgi:hypothetical protein